MSELLSQRSRPFAERKWSAGCRALQPGLGQWMWAVDPVAWSAPWRGSWLWPEYRLTGHSESCHEQHCPLKRRAAPDFRSGPAALWVFNFDLGQAGAYDLKLVASLHAADLSCIRGTELVSVAGPGRGRFRACRPDGGAGGQESARTNLGARWATLLTVRSALAVAAGALGDVYRDL